MIVLDTDHLSILQYPDRRQSEALLAAMWRSTESEFVATAVSVEEEFRGWLSAIRRAKTVHNQILYYTRLTGLVRFFNKWQILPFNEPAADRFEALRKQRVRIGTQDLKIASIALEAGALLLTANLRDFERVPGLRVENWLR
jgi:tRNA(fMet)-specific endonuclease VapC